MKLNVHKEVKIISTVIAEKSIATKTEATYESTCNDDAAQEEENHQLACVAVLNLLDCRRRSLELLQPGNMNNSEDSESDEECGKTEELFD